MKTRLLGKIGYYATIITLGGFALGYVSQEEADKAVTLAMREGINVIDVGPNYGKAETRLRPWIEKYRERFFLAEKTLERTRKKAWLELNRSLKRLGTDYFDLYQFHAVGSTDELRQIFGKDGAIEAFREAKEVGLVEYIGITGHRDVRVLIKALEFFEFDAVMTQVNVASMINPNPISDFRPLLKIAEENDIGVISIKAIAWRRWIDEKKYGTWYEPLDKQNEIDIALFFTLSHEGVTTYSLTGDIKLWPQVLDAAKRYKKMSEEEMQEAINFAKEHNFKPLYPGALFEFEKGKTIP